MIIKLRKTIIKIITIVILFCLLFICFWFMKYKMLFLSVRSNNLMFLRLCIIIGANINSKIDNGRTALMVATCNRQNKIVELLIKNGADVNATENNGWTSLMMSANSNSFPCSPEIVNILLKNGADPNVQTIKNGYTALMLAVMKRHKEVVKSLLAFNADPNITNYKNGATAIFYATLTGDLDMVKLLFANGAKLKLEANNGKTLLFIAAQEVKPEIFNFLMKNGANYKKEFNENGKYIGNDGDHALSKNPR